MRNFRNLVLGLVLVILSPLGWGEDVYYCVEEHSVELAPTDSGDTYELIRNKQEKFTFKYEPDSNRLAFKGRTWSGDEPWYLDCLFCKASRAMFLATDLDITFKVNNGRFNYAAVDFSYVDAKTGTCTKF